MQYEHTQHAPLHLLLHLVAIAMVVSTCVMFGQEPGLALILAPTAMLFFLLGLMFAHLNVRDEGDWLAVRFGPLRLFGTRVQYSDITSVKRGRSALIDGFGIHCMPGRGWTFNLWGFECVELIVNGRKLRIGTDDSENLAAFLKSRMPQDSTPATQ